MNRKFLFFCVSILTVSSAFAQSDTVYVQRVTKSGFENKEVKAWEATAYAERQMQKRFEWGVKGGINTSGITKRSQTAFTQRFEGIGVYEGIKNSNKGVGWQVGAFGRVNFSEFNLQLEVLYSNSRSINTMMTLPSDADIPITNAVTFHNKDIPLELGFKFSIFRIYFGPQFSIPLPSSVDFDNAKAKEFMDGTDGGYVINKVDFKNPNIFFHWGVSFEFWHAVIDIRNVVPFEKSRQRFYIHDRCNSESMRLNSWQFMLGFKF